MAYALIDNATLTAVQRLLGKIKVRSGDSIDSDIAALENLVQAILFYDDLLCIDNYKEEFRAQRAAEFDFIRFIEEDKYGLDEVERIAADESSKMTPTIRGGEFADQDFAEFLDLLKMNIVCTWDLRSSIYYLTMKMLGKSSSAEYSKFNALSATIFQELMDRDETQGPASKPPLLIDSRGQIIKKGYAIPGAKSGGGETGGMTGALAAFVASLSWISFKTIYYSLAAKHLKADTFLYPIRQAFQLHYMEKRHAYGPDFTSSIIERLNTEVSKDVGKIISSDRSTAVSIDIPFFSSWLVMQCGDVKDVLGAASEIRNTPDISEARGQLREIRLLFDSEDMVAANKKIASIILDVSKSTADLVAKYGYKPQQGIQTTRLMQIYNTFAAVKGLPTLPEYSGKIPLPDFLRDMIRPKGFATLYRNISSDLTKIWKLGEARDRLEARVETTEDSPCYNPQVEDEKFLRAHSWWKSPM